MVYAYMLNLVSIALRCHTQVAKTQILPCFAFDMWCHQSAAYRESWTQVYIRKYSSYQQYQNRLFIPTHSGGSVHNSVVHKRDRLQIW